MTTQTPTPTPIMSSEVSNLTDAQAISLLVSAVPIALVTICASSLIIVAVSKREKIDSLGRILVGMSMSDVMGTSQMCFQFFLTPGYQSQRITDVGNDATCNALGFFWQLSSAVYWYNGVLCIYYFVTIVWGWTETKFQKYEPYLHGTAMGFPLVTAILGAVFNWYGPNELGPGCWVNDVPTNCGDEPWETGETCYGEEIAWAIGGLPILVIFFVVIICNIRIYRHVKTSLHRSHRFLMNMDSQARRLRQSILAPSTGSWNLLVFLRPRYLKCRSDFPEQSRVWAFKRALFGAIVEPAPPSSHRNSVSSIEQPAKKNSNPANEPPECAQPMEAIAYVAVEDGNKLPKGRQEDSGDARVHFEDQSNLSANCSCD